TMLRIQAQDVAVRAGITKGRGAGKTTLNNAIIYHFAATRDKGKFNLRNYQKLSKILQE
ncbi:hypothetical protein F442_06719, partial [Phytophthora nicotianae P10297]